VPFAAYFDLVAALEARLANGTVQRCLKWCLKPK
jgi:hypothetical protein